MIEVRGGLRVTVNGQTARVEAAGQQCVVDVDDPRAFSRAVPRLAGAGGGGSPLDALRAVAAGLAGAGLTVRVVSRGSLVVTLGRDVRPGLGSRLVGSPYVAPGSPLGLLRLLGS
ncbi:MAG TPA: hypothetical protein VII06_03815 [Chloroflexota bacterium]